jgi:Tfp pilus assembly protein PilO
MNKSTERVLMILFAVLAVGFAVLFLSANGRNGALIREKDELIAQDETLKAENAEAAEKAAAKLKEVTAQRDDLEAKLDEATQLNTALTLESEDAAQQIDELTAKLKTAQGETENADRAGGNAEDRCGKGGGGRGREAG